MKLNYKICNKCGKAKHKTEYNFEALGKLQRKAACRGCLSHFRGGVSHVLVIGDLHAPFIKKGYLKFVKSIYKKYKCTDVIFIGDLIDNHYSSFWTADPDGYSAGEELERAIDILQDWYKAFPIATVTLGNHDLRIARKMLEAGLSKRWMKSYSNVLETPGWTFVDSYELNDVFYTHGGGGKAAVKSKKDLMSTVQGHYHPEANITYHVGRKFKIFGMQVGSGFDEKSYAASYGKHHPKSAISCGVVLNDGQLPILEMMELN
jgi:metallophosphoesterase superfamily enzyme